MSIVDDGVDVFHEDLNANFGEGNYSYVPEGAQPFSGRHGTACAGIIGAAEGNGLGIRGIAPQARLIAFNALQAPSTANLADALVRELDEVDVSNNSWGDFNGWGEPLKLRAGVEEALSKGVAQGRNGKGIIYVFAAGNGAAKDDQPIPTDNVNYSGYVNNRFTIPVCAIGADGKGASYSEEGSTLVVCAPSSSRDGLPGIVTTDVEGEAGYNPHLTANDTDDVGYTLNFGGTSAATPMVSGVAALMLEANPHLTWRDVKAILAFSAAMNDPDDASWSWTKAGLHVSHRYGFGLVDAKAATTLATQWRPFGPELVKEYRADVNEDIPDDDVQGITSVIEVQQNFDIEFVDLILDAPEHKRIGDLMVLLTCPSGTQSVLATPHRQRFGAFLYSKWRFGTVRCLGEKSHGNWLLQVADLSQDVTGQLNSWTLRIYGHATSL